MQTDKERQHPTHQFILSPHDNNPNIQHKVTITDDLNQICQQIQSLENTITELKKEELIEKDKRATTQTQLISLEELQRQEQITTLCDRVSTYKEKQALIFLDLFKRGTTPNIPSTTTSLTLMTQLKQEQLLTGDHNTTAPAPVDSSSALSENVLLLNNKAHIPPEVTTVKGQKQQQEEDEQKAFSVGCVGGCRGTFFWDTKENNMVCHKCGVVRSTGACAPFGCGEAVTDKDDPENSCDAGSPSGEYDCDKQTSHGKHHGYDPISHFHEILINIQGKRQSEINRQIIEEVTELCDKWNVPKYKRDTKSVRAALQQLQRGAVSKVRSNGTATIARSKYKHYSEFYKQAPEIACQLSGHLPPIISSVQEEMIMGVYKLAILAYKTSPHQIEREGIKKGRKKRIPNNMNCNYYLYKICHLLGYTEFLKYLKLSKNQSNIDDCDEKAWKHICKTWGWAYCPTR